MKRVLITGGNKGIGLEITRLFLDRGDFEVLVLGRSFENMPGEIKDRVKEIEYDLENIAGIKELVTEIGYIDVLINNAGVMFKKTYADYDEETKIKSLKVNLEAPVELISHFAPLMQAQKSGRIVNVASIAGHTGHPDIWYGISKAGIINLTKSFAKTLGSSGIVINCVAPGQVSTDMLQVIPKERQEMFINNSILKRPAKPDEVAKTVFWLATDSPEFMNGACLDINNGVFLR
jgi:3-oxoacyl-[acyl-carrier protein] reductase